jgi:hypothetical protein
MRENGPFAPLEESSMGENGPFAGQLSSMSKPPPPPDGGADSERASRGVDLSCGRQVGEGARGAAGAGEERGEHRVTGRPTAPIPSPAAASTLLGFRVHGAGELEPRGDEQRRPPLAHRPRGQDGASVRSIAFGDNTWRFYAAFLRCLPLSKGAGHAVAGESKTVPFSGPTKSYHLLDVSFKHQVWIGREKERVDAGRAAPRVGERWKIHDKLSFCSDFLQSS